MPKPQRPITMLVKPCRFDGATVPSQHNSASRWVWGSMKPGVTQQSPASTVRRPGPLSPGCGDGGDHPAVNCDIGPPRRSAGAIDDGAISDDEIVHEPSVIIRRSVRSMLQGEKILVTGPAGQIAFPLASSAGPATTTSGASRASAMRRHGNGSRPPASRHVLAISPVATSTSCPTTSPTCCTSPRSRNGGLDYDEAMRVNAEGTALCYCSTAARRRRRWSCRRPRSTNRNSTRMHVYLETDPLGDSNSLFDATYSMSKIAQEAVARDPARACLRPAGRHRADERLVRRQRRSAHVPPRLDT